MLVNEINTTIGIRKATRSRKTMDKPSTLTINIGSPIILSKVKIQVDNIVILRIYLSFLVNEVIIEAKLVRNNPMKAYRNNSSRCDGFLPMDISNEP